MTTTKDPARSAGAPSEGSESSSADGAGYGAEPHRGGGVMFRVAEELFFLPAEVAIKVMPVPEIAIVPGAPIELRGIALVDGDMIAVVELRSLDFDSSDLLDERSPVVNLRSGAMLVC